MPNLRSNLKLNVLQALKFKYDFLKSSANVSEIICTEIALV